MFYPHMLGVALPSMGMAEALGAEQAHPPLPAPPTEVALVFFLVELGDIGRVG